MTARRLLTLPLVLALSLAAISCGEKKEEYKSEDEKQQEESGYVTWEMVRDKGPITRTNPKTGVTWTIVGIKEDKVDHARAKQNAEDALSAHPDLVGMIGLWAYNPPYIHQAVKARKKLDQVKIVAFDEHKDTLLAIADGEMVGTIVQNPYEFGFRSVEYLAATLRGQAVDIPNNKLIFIPTRVITQDNIDAFSQLTKNILAGNGPTPGHDITKYDTTKRVSTLFVANVKDDFWKFAVQGCKLGGKTFNVDAAAYIPPEQGNEVAQQKAKIDQEIGSIDGLAISVNDPTNQNQMINDWAEKVTVITVDSDAPESDRKYYLGTDNIAAGVQAGELLAEAAPKGGKVMIFVGSLAQANAQERSQGVINALLGQE